MSDDMPAVKRTGGRPRLPPDKRLSEVLPFRATPDEADEVHREALRRGITTTEYIREKVLGRK